MPSAVIKLTGGRELSEALQATMPRLARRLVGRMTLAGARYMKGKWIAAAPVDTAALQKGIDVMRARTRGMIVGAWVGLIKDVYYGRFVELGTVHAPPHPWAGPATERHSSDTAQEMVDFARDDFENNFGNRV